MLAIGVTALLRAKECCNARDAAPSADPRYDDGHSPLPTAATLPVPLGVVGLNEVTPTSLGPLRPETASSCEPVPGQLLERLETHLHAIHQLQ